MILFPKYSGGKYKNDKSTMILSRGLGISFPTAGLFNDLVVDSPVVVNN